MYRTERLRLLVTPAAKTAVVPMAEDKRLGCTSEASAASPAQLQQEPGHAPRLPTLDSRLPLPFQPRILLFNYALIQLFEQRRRLAQRLARGQLARRPGADGATVIVGQRVVAARLFLVLDHLLRARWRGTATARRSPGTRAASARYAAGLAPGASSGCPQRAG